MRTRAILVLLLALTGCTERLEPDLSPKAPVEELKTAAVVKTLNKMFSGSTNVYLQRGPLISDSLSKDLEFPFKLTTREDYDSQFRLKGADRPTLVVVRVFRNEGEPDSTFHVLVGYRGRIGVGGQKHSKYRAQNGECVLVDESDVVQ